MSKMKNPFIKSFENNRSYFMQSDARVLLSSDSKLSLKIRLLHGSEGDMIVLSGFGASAGCTSKALGGSHSPPKIEQWIGTYMQTMGSPGLLLCSTQGKHKTVWVGPNEKQIVSGSKYKVCTAALPQINGKESTSAVP